MTYPDAPLKESAALKYVEQRLGYPLDALLSFPRFFLIEPVNICNARCIMCGIDFTKKKKAVMSDSLFDKIADEVAKYSNHVEKVMLYLDCEPLLDKKLPLRIQKMKKSGIRRVNVASNASLLDYDRASRIIKAGLDEIYITIDSLQKDRFEAIRKGLQFETVYKNILDFIQLRNQLNPRLTIRIQMVLQQLNQDEAGAFVCHWTSLLNPDDQVIVQKAHNWGATVKTMKFGDEGAINNVPCFILWSNFCIHVDGEVALCCMDTESTLSLGNVSSQSIAEIWAGTVLKRIREEHTCGRRADIPLCNGCTAWRDTKHYKEQIVETG
jgi:radical SAM protein with 4Fe4S-binding SPASM domain